MLEELKEKYEELRILLDLSTSYLKDLENSKAIKRYKEVIQTIQELEKELRELESKIELYSAKEKIRNCSHIFIISGEDSTIYQSDEHSSESPREFHTCIKCELDTKFRYKGQNSITNELQLYMKEIEPDVIDNGIKLNIECDGELGIAIYQGLLNIYPDMTDEEAVLYFKEYYTLIMTNPDDEVIKRLTLDQRLGIKSTITKGKMD